MPKWFLRGSLKAVGKIFNISLESNMPRSNIENMPIISTKIDRILSQDATLDFTDDLSYRCEYYSDVYNPTIITPSPHFDKKILVFPQDEL